MLEKIITVDQINVLENGQIQVRTATAIKEDNIQISKSYHRHVLNPGDDLTGQDSRVTAIANTIWTPEVIQTYQDSLTA